MKTIKYFLVIVILGISQLSFSQTTWFWTNVGGDSLFSNANNWDDGFGTTGIPVSGDDVYFDPGWSLDNCIFNQAVSVNTFNMMSGYTGRITQSTNILATQGAFNFYGGTFLQGATITLGSTSVSPTFSGTLNMSAGTFVGASQTITINGSFNQTGGTFKSTSGTMNIRRNFTSSGSSTFTHRNGTVVFQSISGTTLHTIYNTPTFYNLSLQTRTTLNDTFTYTINDTFTGITVANTLTIATAGGINTRLLNINTGIINAQGNVTVTGTSTNSGNSGTGTIIFNGTGVQILTGLVSSVQFGFVPKVTINKASGTLFLKDNISVAGSWTYSQGTVDVTTNANSVCFYNAINIDGQGTSTTMSFRDIKIQTNTSTLTGNLDVNGTITTASGTTLATNTFDVNVWTLTSAGSVTQSGGTFTLDHATAGSHTLAGTNSFNNLTINANNTLTSTSGILTIGGVLSNSGTFIHNSGTVSFAGTTSISGTVPDLNNVTIASGTFTAPAGTLNVAGNFTNSAAFTHSSGTLNFNGTTSFTPGASSYNNITVNGTSVTLAGTLDVNDTLTITSGILDVSSSNYGITCSGTWIKNGGTFTPQSGTVTFDGVACQYGGSQATTFYAVEIPVSCNLTVPTTKTLNATNFTVKSSNSSNTGNLVVQGTGAVNVSGTSICERYIPNVSIYYHHVSSPCAAAAQAASFNKYYLQDYITASSTYSKLTAASNMVAGRGYAAKKATGGLDIISFKGAYNSGDVSLGLGVGWNIVGNPYPSTIDIDGSGWGTTWSSVRTIYFYNGATYDSWQQGDSHTGIGSGRSDCYIAPGEGGFVEALSGGSWTPSNAVRVTNSRAMHKGEESKSSRPNLLRVFVADSINNDQLVIVFREDGALNEYDAKWDANKYFGKATVPQISSYPQGDTLSQLVINSFDSFSLFDSVTTIPVDFTCNSAGNFVLSSGNIDSFDPLMTIILEDTVANKTVDFRTTNYSFTTTGPSSAKKRFFIHFMPEIITNVDDKNSTTISSNYSMFYSNNALYIKNNINKPINGDLIIYDMAGREVFNTKINTNSVSKVQMNNLTGIYITKLITTDGVYAQKVYMK